MFAPRTPCVILLCSVIGCQSSPEVTRDIANPLVRPDTFKVVTYNTLHGLEVSKLWVRTVESDNERLARFAARIDQLADVQPDVILLQEVNPLPDMAQQYVRALKERGLDYDQVHQVDAAPGFLLPPCRASSRAKSCIFPCGRFPDRCLSSSRRPILPLCAR